MFRYIHIVTLFIEIVNQCVWAVIGPENFSLQDTKIFSINIGLLDHFFENFCLPLKILVPLI